MYLKYYSKDNLVRIEKLNLTEVTSEVLGDAQAGFEFYSEFYNYNYSLVESLTKQLSKQKGQRYNFDDVALELEDLSWQSVINFDDSDTTTLGERDTKAFINALAQAIEKGDKIFDVCKWYKKYKTEEVND